MTEFAYRAASANAPERGRIDAPDATAARRALRERGLVPIDVRPVGAAARWSLGAPARSTVRSADRVWFFRTLERFLSRGAPLEEGVAAAEDLASTPARREASSRVLERLRQGDSLADACAAAPGLALPRYSAILRVGHASGRLARSVAVVADSLENDPTTIERVAREGYGMIREGETLYRFADTEPVTESEEAAPTETVPAR